MDGRRKGKGGRGEGKGDCKLCSDGRVREGKEGGRREEGKA